MEHWDAQVFSTLPAYARSRWIIIMHSCGLTGPIGMPDIIPVSIVVLNAFYCSFGQWVVAMVTTDYGNIALGLPMGYSLILLSYTLSITNSDLGASEAWLD